MKIIAIIPARFKSSRFPGKPLAQINNRPMIWWVYQRCKKVKEFQDVIVATDDERIFETCELLHIKVVMTSSNCLTGTDRVGEVADMFPADLYVNVQGDEPLIEPEVIRCVLEPFLIDKSLDVCNLMTKIKEPSQIINATIPKVLTNKDNYAVYLTRAAVPYPQGKTTYDYYKQVCVYGFTPRALSFYSKYGKTYGKAKLESIEDIEILRFIENGIKVKYVEIETASIAVDTQKDLERVCKYVEENNISESFI